MSKRQQAAGSDRLTLCNLTVTAALSAQGQTPVLGLAAARVVTLEAIFGYGSGGTSADVYVQTSLDGGLTWFDIANFHFLTSTLSKVSTVVNEPSAPFTAGTAPGSGVLTANTVLNGILGDRLRALVTTVGIYAGGTTLKVFATTKT